MECWTFENLDQNQGNDGVKKCREHPNGPGETCYRIYQKSTAVWEKKICSGREER